MQQDSMRWARDGTEIGIMPSWMVRMTSLLQQINPLTVPSNSIKRNKK